MIKIQTKLYKQTCTHTHTHTRARKKQFCWKI